MVTTYDQLEGCSCPYTVVLEKQMSRGALRNCETVTVTTRMAYLNDVVGTGSLLLRDSFPPGCEITEVLYNPYGGNINGLGSNILEISDISPAYGVDSLVLSVFIPEDMESGSYYCQASLSGLDLSALGDGRERVNSDNPDSPERYDPTPFSVEKLESLSPQTTYELCAGEKLTLRLTSNSTGLSYSWEDGSTADSLLIGKSGGYSVTVSNGCRQEAFTLQVLPSLLNVDLGGGKTLLPGASITLEPAVESFSPILEYKWYANDTSALSCLQCLTNEVAPYHDATIVGLQVLNANGCRAADEVTIKIKRPVYAPTAFSPNGDGINDHFFLHTPGAESVHLQIFGRWGELLWESRNSPPNSPEGGWKGAAGNQPVPAGMYVWAAKVIYPGASRQSLSGEVLLMR